MAHPEHESAPRRDGRFTYPRSPYPGFKDPDDWREISNEIAPGGQVQALAVQAVADATADHIGKHTAHDHPWCEHCWFRTVREEAEGRDLPLIGPVFDSLREGIDYDATTGTRRRAERYLVLNHRPPRDTFDPDAEAEATLDDEFLDRDQLDELPTPEPLIEGVLPRHSYGILRGRDGTYKSFVALDWALCLATGKPWQGRAAEQVRVLYIAGEGAYGLAARVDAWEQAWATEVDPGSFQVRRSALNLHKPGPAFGHLLTWVQDGGFGLVVVDTLRRVAGGADGNSSEMGAVVDNLDRIKKATLDGTVLLIAHTDKGDSDSRGYSGIEDDADVVWHAKRDENELALHLTKMKDGPDGAEIRLAAQSVEDSLILIGSDSKTRPVSATANQIRLLDTMRSAFRDGAHSGQLRDASGLPSSSFHRALSELRDAGHLINTGTKQRPFYELAPTALPPRDEPISRSTPTTPTPLPPHSQPQPYLLPPTPTSLKGGSGSRGGLEAMENA